MSDRRAEGATSAEAGSGDVDAFLASRPDDQREALGKLREVVRTTAPTATEGISYGVPTFKVKGRPLVGFGAGKSHCSFYLLSTSVMESHRADLEGYDTGKGSIRFLPEAPLPEALVRKLVLARITGNDERTGG